MRLNILLFSNNFVEMKNLTAYAGDMPYGDYNRITDINKLQGEYISRISDINAQANNRISELLKNYTRSFEDIPAGELKTVTAKRYSGGLAQMADTSKDFVRVTSDVAKPNVKVNTINSYVSASDRPAKIADSYVTASAINNKASGGYFSAHSTGKPAVTFIDSSSVGGKALKKEDSDKTAQGIFQKAVAVKNVEGRPGVINSSIGEGFATATATTNAALKGIDFDKVEFSLEEVSKAAQDLKNALARIEGNISKVVDFSFLDKDINREKDKLKNKNKELIDDYDAKRKKAIAYLSGSDGQGGIVGKLKEDLKRTINVRNAILEAEGISAELYDEQYGDYISSIDDSANEYISSINDSFGDFVTENDAQYFTAEENKNVKDAYDQINKLQDEYKTQVEKEKESVVEAYQKDLDKQKATVEEQKAILEQEKNKTISQYQEDLAKQKAEVEQQQAILDKQKNEAISAYQEELQKQQADAEQQKAILEQEKNKAISSYQEELQKQQAEVDQQKAILEQEKNNALSQYQTELQKQQASIGEQKAILEQQKNNTINQYQTELQNVQKQYQTELQNAQNQYKAELQNAQTQYNNELQKATAEIEANKMQYQNEVNAALQEYQNSLNSQLQNIQMMNFLNN